MSDKIESLIGGRLLVRNVMWNLFGTGAPLLMALISIPLLIEELGIARFGILTLAWMVVGYFSLFDLGLGRALTKLVSEMLGKKNYDDIPRITWTALFLMTVLGVIGTVILALISPWLVESVLKVPIELHSETIMSFYVLAASIPIVIGATGLRGILEAHQRFGLINVVRIALGVFTFLGPVAVLPFSNNLIPIVIILVIARLISCVIYAIFCLRVDPNFGNSINIHRRMIGPLISFGGWMTVSNIIDPLMVYLDRFLIGSIVSMTAVAFYATPFEIVTKLWIIPGAIVGVLFPAFALTFAQDCAHAAELFVRAVSYIFLTLFPIALFIVSFSDMGLTYWLGSDFALNSSLVLQLLTIGVFINCHAHVPSGLIQSAGRPDLTAKLHLLELPFYLLTLWWIVETYGIIGATLAWVIRVFFDTLLLFIIAQKFLPSITVFSIKVIFISSMAFFMLALSAFAQGVYTKTLFLLFTFIIFIVVAWNLILKNDEKVIIQNKIKVIQLFG